VSNLKKQEYIESFFTDSILNLLEAQKLKNICVFKGNSESSHQKVIIGTSASNTQMNGVVNKMNKFINEKSNLIIEGRNSSWLLIEVKGILIHIFTQESREFYMLEDLYFDCELIYQHG
jgi:ribosome silencing factor RsfS/YbeB/iojap